MSDCYRENHHRLSLFPFSTHFFPSPLSLSILRPIHDEGFASLKKKKKNANCSVSREIGEKEGGRYRLNWLIIVLLLLRCIRPYVRTCACACAQQRTRYFINIIVIIKNLMEICNFTKFPAFLACPDARVACVSQSIAQ